MSVCESKSSTIRFVAAVTGLWRQDDCVVRMANLRMADARTMCTAYNYNVCCSSTLLRWLFIVLFPSDRTFRYLRSPNSMNDPHFLCTPFYDIHVFSLPPLLSPSPSLYPIFPSRSPYPSLIFLATSNWSLPIYFSNRLLPQQPVESLWHAIGCQTYSFMPSIGFTVTSYTVSRGHPAPLVGKRFLGGELCVYFCLDSCLVYINFAHT